MLLPYLSHILKQTRGLVVGAGDAGVTPPAVPQDGDSSWYRPQTGAHFTALSMAVPTSLYLCQDAGGNLVDAIGGLDLAKIGAGAASYGVAVPGWTDPGVGLAAGVAAGFVLGAGSGPDPSTTSQLWIWYLDFTAIPASLSQVFALLGSNAQRVQLLNTATLRARSGGNVANGAADVVAGGAIVLVEQIDRAAGRYGVFTADEKILPAYAAPTDDGDKGICADAAASAAPMTILWGCRYDGAAAELDDVALKALVQKLNITISWT